MPSVRIKLPFATEPEFWERLGPQLLEGKIFVPHPSPRPLGTELTLKLELLDGGVAVLNHARVEAHGSAARSGMVLRLSGVTRASVRFAKADKSGSVADELQTTLHRYESGFLDTLLSTDAGTPGAPGSDPFGGATVPVRGSAGVMQEVLRVRSKLDGAVVRRRFLRWLPLAVAFALGVALTAWWMRGGR